MTGSSESVFIGEPPIPVVLRRSARARRITLRISSLDGRVTLTLPRRLPQADALDFARSKEPWIRKHLAQRVPDVPVTFDVEIPVAGKMRQIIPGAGRRVAIGADHIAVPGPAERVGVRLAAHLKTLAREQLVASSDHYAGVLGKDYSRITLRDTRSRWGSCSSAGALMYSWRLILAPPEVLNYVAAHEVAHLAHMNHAPAFWEEVERIHGPYRELRKWLHREGTALHRYKF